MRRLNPRALPWATLELARQAKKLSQIQLRPYRRLRDEVAAFGWVWPTEHQDRSDQQVLHSPDIEVQLDVDFSVVHTDPKKKDRLSEHPFISISVSSR
jgi:hypothetical protein